MIAASTVDMALRKLSERPDVMLVDFHLHDRMDGLDALVALREAAGRCPARCSPPMAATN
ncbi:hypothetical protein OK348_13790 [Flavobacterium sp. MXW15]|uniref:Response regulatory domain-containing protein n=1 Tax=Xanthomonas chitinilytica TaxID=2989819 RepID=A0ABT3JXN5_9XANT|nr:hypothetical protein [Xanthomonas sp. H13-6]MCW4455857.1 hypothetical protein [Flavobacterium sp. MXW15]MCW4473233.1 hypothetical protein [Xanthomonas sp. H13-6]